MKKYEKNKDQQFYAYYDTIEKTGEVIYCGKGNDYRSEPNVEANKRFGYNKFFNKIAKKHKIIRTRLECLDEDLALQFENWLMERYHTWIDDPLATKHACNIFGPGTNAKSQCLSQYVKTKIGIANSEIILQIDKEGNIIREWQSAREILKILKFHGISQCCLRIYNYAHGYIWRYKYENLSSEQLKNEAQEIKEKIKLSNLLRNKRKNKAVIQYDKNMNFIAEFESIKIAMYITGVTRDSISACCQGKQKFAGEFIWKFVN